MISNFTLVLGSAAMILLLIILVISISFSARKQRLRQELNEANYQTRLNQATLTALRSQMNPHFIFNCLNSIKYFTEQNNSETAALYLNKFARLIRKTLDNAGKEKIILSEEVASLQLYLELEAMRFKDKLEYSINVDSNVDADFIELPPMIVQPYAENAIWHGLMPKKEGGILTIHISQEDDTAVYIVIRDNGIGRTKAAELKMKQSPEHQSIGTKITGERIALLNERQHQSAHVDIVDEFTDGQAAGTIVTIKLPLK